MDWLCNHQTAEKVLFGLIAVTLFIAIANGFFDLNAAVATAVVVFFWGLYRQGGVVADGKHGDNKGTRKPGASPKVAPPDELPEFAKKADDLDAIKKAVDDAASVSGGLWLSYLFVLFYLAVAAGAVTHLDLFFERAVKLPFLGIDLPLVAFFFVAPILFVIVHAYTLVHLVMLTDKAKRYHQALYVQSEKTGWEAKRLEETRDKLRRQLPSNIFIQFLAGPSDLRESKFGWLLLGIGGITLVVAPVLLLLTIQIQFLPYHHVWIAWTQRIALLFDLAVVWWLWRKVLSGGESAARESDGGESAATAPRTSLIPVRIGVLFTFLAIAFSWAIATFPGERQEKLLAKWDQYLLAKWDQQLWAVTVHKALFSADPNEFTHRRLPFSNTLVLPSLNVYEGLSIDDPKKAEWRDFVFHPRGRDLREAIFNSASLPRVDFTGADLQGARFVNAQLQGAWFDRAQLQGASLDQAQLQGTFLELAQLQGASLDSAQLQGTSLNAARLQGANLSGAQLQGASLAGTDLQGANLSGARLQGASLNGADLQGALFNNAQLQGASFSGATLKATDLNGAYLWRSDQAGIPAMLLALPKVAEDKKTWNPWWQDLKQQAGVWDDKNQAYSELLASLKSLPDGPLRGAALKRIAVLDCSSPDKTLQPCDPGPAATLPQEATDWKSAVMGSMVDVKPYRAALAESLRALFCQGDEYEALVVRNVADLKFDQLHKAGPDALGLIADLLNKNSSDCPVAASLTEADRAKLIGIQQDIKSLPKLGLTNPR
jgi:uncharacterized protein YjbI with pentapeptide repeats